MSKEVLAAISHTYELGNYATAELQGLFDDWLREIEQLILTFIGKQNRVDPDKIAAHFKLKRESVIFILSKLTREGRVAMQASSTAPKNIRLIRQEES